MSRLSHYFQPVELLYKALSEFQDDLGPRGIPLTTVYQIYEEHERERQSKTKEIEMKTL